MRRAVAAVTLLVTGAAQLGPGATEAQAQAQGCQRYDDRGQCVVELPVPVEAEQPSPGDGGDTGSGSGGGRPAPRPVCQWVTVPAGPETDANLRRLFPEAPPGSVLQVKDCGDTSPGTPGGTDLEWGARWLPPGAPTEPEPPSPATIALTLYTRVQASMLAPTLASNPPADAPAVVGLPVFVEVLNWQGPLTDSECVLGVCVEMTATPSLELTPGEAGAPVVRCDPPGTRFDAALADAEAQAAAPGACAYAYRLRTGIEGRPGEWPGQVTVRWAVSWTSNVGVSGSFPELALSTPAPRLVNEVQTVVAESS